MTSHSLYGVIIHNSCFYFITSVQNNVFKGGLHPVDDKILVFLMSCIPSGKCSLKSHSYVQLLNRAFVYASLFLTLFLTVFHFKQKVESSVFQFLLFM